MLERFEWLEFEDNSATSPEGPSNPLSLNGQFAGIREERTLAAPLPQSRSLTALGVELPERRLDLVPSSPCWPVESLELYQLRLEAERLRLATGFERLVCLDSTRIERLEHQQETALRVLRDMRGRALLADEVGLGKTIEAGIVMKELLIRGLVERILVLVPASLTHQWQEELASKFDESFDIVRHPEDWSKPKLVASLDLAKQARHATYALATRYDLLIVDEAHKLKARTTMAHQFVNKLAKRFVLLLTATPVQNSLDELYNLVTLLQPGQLGTTKGFADAHIEAGDARVPRNPSALRHRLNEVMVRNRRSTVGLTLPPRRAGIYHINLPPDERRLYDGLTDFIHTELALEPDARHLRLVLATLQRELTSSPQAVASTLKKLISDPGRDPQTKGILRQFLALAEGIGVGRKVRAVAELIERLESEDKVIVFTEFRATQAQLVTHLRACGHDVTEFHGGLDSDAKEAAIDAFRNKSRILVSTESGAEGRNLQFCSVLINHDLPWNPMRVEQRIGRIHRLGQTRPVTILNLSSNDTIEAELVELLAQKIRMFELVVGELDLILGDAEGFETLLTRAWIGARGESAALNLAFDGLGKTIEAAWQDYREVRKAGDRLADLLEGTSR